MTSAIASVVPVAARADSDLLMWALGYQPDQSTGASTYSVPLSPAGAEPATHYGCNMQAVDDDFITLVTDAKAGQVPPLDWAAFGLTDERVADVFEAMEFEVTGVDDRPWDALLERLTLRTLDEDL